MSPSPQDETLTRAPRERWGTLGSFLLASFYLWLLAWLIAFVAVPAIGLRWEPVVITSGSMEPLIRPGDVVLAQPPAEPDDLGPGTVITFDDPIRPGELTTHRILGVNPDGTYRTRGDANAVPDSTPVPPDDVVGVGRLLVPMIGLPITWMRGAVTLFMAWVAVTAVACVVATRDLEAQPVEADDDGPSGPPVTGWRRLTPGLVQQRLVHRLTGPVLHARRRLTTMSDRLAPRVQATLRAAEEVRAVPAGRIRTWAPFTVAIAGTAGLARTLPTLLIGVSLIALALLGDPRGPELRIGRWWVDGRRRAIAARRTAATMRERIPDPLELAMKPAFAITLVVVLAAPVMMRSSAVFSNAAEVPDNSVAAASSFGTPWPTMHGHAAGTTDHPATTTLPLDTSEPTSSTLLNTDSDRNTDPGLTLKVSTVGDAETDPERTQTWRFDPPDGTYSGNLQLVFTSAVANFTTGTPGHLQWFVRKCDGAACTTFASADVSRASWASTADWVVSTADLGAATQTFGAADVLEIKVVVGPGTSGPMWLAFDTTSHPLRLEVR